MDQQQAAQQRQQRRKQLNRAIWGWALLVVGAFFALLKPAFLFMALFGLLLLQSSSVGRMAIRWFIVAVAAAVLWAGLRARGIEWPGRFF